MVISYKAGGDKKETPSIFPVKAERKEPVIEAPKEHDQEDLLSPDEEIVAADFSQEQLNEAWKKFAEKKAAGQISDSLKMVFKRPLLKQEGAVAEIELSTEIEKKFLKAEETEIVQFIRKELGHPSVTLRITIKEAELKHRLYTDKEKFNYLAKKQPLLLTLKEKLYLDTDF